ncbi:MAG TPA: ABC transporter ATP-binding protein [Polyangiaceae bacterium]|nr:ABC transporter ATP-binding protein [Polyangiaceae bacterium]
MIEVEGLTKRYGDFTAVDRLTLGVRRGELFALLGPNGAGKTTTLRMLLGFLKASAGSARIAGRDCFEERVELKRVVGYLPDDPVFYDYLRGRELIEFSGEMHGLTRAVIAERSAPLVRELELAEALEDYAVNYSRGMKKKLSLVCALIHEPELLILDEPSSGLDPIATRRLNQLLLARKAAGVTILLSSHLLDQVEKLCDRVAIVAHGRLAAVGTVEELQANLHPGGSLEDVFFAVTAGGAEAP